MHWIFKLETNFTAYVSCITDLCLNNFNLKNAHIWFPVKTQNNLRVITLTSLHSKHPWFLMVHIENTGTYMQVFLFSDFFYNFELSFRMFTITKFSSLLHIIIWRRYYSVDNVVKHPNGRLWKQRIHYRQKMGVSVLLRPFTSNNDFVCIDVLRPSQPSRVMSSAVSLPNHTFTGQA